MRAVLDENVSSGLLGPLKAMGIDVLVVGRDLPSGSSDEEVFRFALKERALLLTRDYHFTNPVRFDAARTLGIIYIHHGNLTSAREISLVTGFLGKHSPGEFLGKLVTLYSNGTKIR